jgi:cytochrome c oxidase subunit 3
MNRDLRGFVQSGAGDSRRGEGMNEISLSRRKIEPAMLGLLLFIAAETMLFAGFISAYLVFRLSPIPWPPADEPRLPVEWPIMNTVVLIGSWFALDQALRALRQGKNRLYLYLLTLAAFLGIVFLVTQGFEWIQMSQAGLTAHVDVYGGFFYILTGLHGVHVLGGILAILWVLGRSWGAAYSSANHLSVDLCRTYWLFVVALWPVLFLLIYL